VHVPDVIDRAALTSKACYLTALIASILLSSTLLLFSAPANEKRISVYSPAANYSLVLSEHGGRNYVGLVEILEPLGRVTAKTEGRKWKLRFKNVDAQFVPASSSARIGRREVDLTGPFLLQNGRGLVPMDALVTLLPELLGSPVQFHGNARRLFIGQSGTTYSAEITSTTPAKLVLNFSAPVNPTIHTETGRLNMLFTRDPVIASGAPNVNFNDKGISSASFQESNGAAELTISGTVPLMASFSNNGRTITIAPAPSGAAAQTPAAQTPTVPQAPGALSPPDAVPPSQPARRFVVAIDASHGGDERGAALSDNLLEKDITLALARRIRQGLENQGVGTLMLRDGDNTLSSDQRAGAANTARVSLYLGLHAANDGTGVHIFTGLLSGAADSRGPFLSWDNAQATVLRASQSTAAIFATSMSKAIPTRALAAPLRPLNNLSAPALAIELAPRVAGNVADLNSAEYQQLVANMIVSAVVSARASLGGGQ
jgi:N-acetylmuramoyl-L-alanine amidase